MAVRAFAAVSAATAVAIPVLVGLSLAQGGGSRSKAVWQAHHEACHQIPEEVYHRDRFRAIRGRVTDPDDRLSFDGGIGLSRSRAATNAINDGFDELIWIDLTWIRPRRCRCFTIPRSARGIRRLSLAGGGVTWNLEGATDFSAAGVPVEVAYAEAGFLLTRREVYLAIQQQKETFACRDPAGVPFVPFFLPLILRETGGQRYLPAGPSFCARACECGFPIVADQRLRPRRILAKAMATSRPRGRRDTRRSLPRRCITLSIASECLRIAVSQYAFLPGYQPVQRVQA